MSTAGAKLRRADFVVLACPLTDQTRGLLGEAEFAMMKPSAVLVNISRAEIADEEGLFAHDGGLPGEHQRGRGLSLVW